jgi:hypothetical protein
MKSYWQSDLTGGSDDSDGQTAVVANANQPCACEVYNEAGRELVMIIVDWVLRGWLTQYIIAMTLPEWKPLRKVNSIETFRRLVGRDLV